MPAYLFAWNPDKWQWDWLEQAVEELAHTGHYSERWSCRAYKSIRPGDRAFLVRLGVEPKGIMGSGYVSTRPFLARHWSGEDKMVHRVIIEFDALLDPAKSTLLGLDALQKEPLNKQTWTPQSSGISISEQVVPELERVWFELLGPSGLGADEAGWQGGEKQFVEGGGAKTETTRYERNPHARRVCIDHYGPACVVCGFDFEEVYGSIGEGFIHVHHLNLISTSAAPRTVDPVHDLRPVCPNCHAMLHRESPPLGVEQLEAMLKDRGGK